MIRFEPGFPNQLLINPRFSENEKAGVLSLKKEFEKKFGPDNYFLVPSSGSSKAAGQSVKLVALHRESVLNSARRVNFYLNAKKENSWGLFLPEFHVAGLGVLARAHLAGAEVETFMFDVGTIAKNLTESGISFLSLVPAQVFDLVQAGKRAPASVKKVFVGGGFLSSGLRQGISALGWPITETYGMTETGSMVAVRELHSQIFELMPGVSAKIQNELLSLHCDSLLSATVQKNGEEISLSEFARDSWFQTEDVAVLREYENGSFLEIKGRRSDYIKILGEGVSLSELRDLILDAGMQLNLHPRQLEVVAVENERAGYELVLAVEESVTADQRQTLMTNYNESSRPYERISRTVVLRQIPRTDLGKLKTEELKRIIKEQG